jgi:hypothetical protein
MPEGPDSFLEKWRARWPEWALAEVFVPAGQRELLLAWLCLRQELLDAAWGGSDPRPGEAKLGWWQEELEAWTRGMRRHPLGRVLQPRNAPWASLAAALPLLAATRDQPAPARLRPIADAMAAVSAALEPGSQAPQWERVAGGLQAQRLLAAAGEGGGTGAGALLDAWPPAAGAQRDPLSTRLFDALLRSRLQVRARGGDGPPARVRTLFAAWRAARGT